MEAGELSMDIQNPKFLHYIQVQAHAAYSKSNRNSGLEVDDFVSVGYESLQKAIKSYNPEHNTRFDSYFTTLLKRDMYKIYLKTHRKKRGGAGSKEDDIRRGAGARWEDSQNAPKPVKHVSLTMDESDDGVPFIQIPAVSNNETEYQILLKQVEKKLPVLLRPVFKQMTDPDVELLNIAKEKAVGKNCCTLTNSMVAQYLNIKNSELREKISKLQEIIACSLGFDVNRWLKLCESRQKKQKA